LYQHLAERDNHISDLRAEILRLREQLRRRLHHEKHSASLSPSSSKNTTSPFASSVPYRAENPHSPSKGGGSSVSLQDPPNNAMSDAPVPRLQEVHLQLVFEKDAQCEFQCRLCPHPSRTKFKNGTPLDHLRRHCEERHASACERMRLYYTAQRLEAIRAKVKW